MAESARWPAFGAGFPALIEVRELPGQVELCLEVTADLKWFAGHFPGEPVLPGIIQTHWAAQFARAAFDFAGQPQRIKRLKFKQVVVPPQILVLALHQASATEVQFGFSSNAGQHSEGRLVFADDLV